MWEIPVAILCSTLVALIVRVLYLLYIIFATECKLEKPDESLKTLFCIGSGGHTTELLRLAKNLQYTIYAPRLYVAASNDVTSEVKIHEAEMQSGCSKYSISRIPRSRNVNQSYFSSVVSTFNALFHTVPIVWRFKPDVIICNGPGTCVPICLVAFVLRCLLVLDCRTIFIESICRVRTLSLTGKILQYFADIVIVQWPQLRDVCFRAKYYGRLT